ncbi:hypothetical protein HanPSC8_Chr14g0622221 [Helianthus annuus]|nr:hypothetical protein HanPSC8_Chr14g0622221 [Helianthus annuus]
MQRRPLRGTLREDEHLSSMVKWCESLQLLPRVNFGDLARVNVPFLVQILVEVLHGKNLEQDVL